MSRLVCQVPSSSSCQRGSPAAFSSSTGTYQLASRSYSATPSSITRSSRCDAGDRHRRLAGAQHRAGVHRVDPLVGEVRGEVGRLLVADVGELGVGPTLGELPPDRECVAYQQELHSSQDTRDGLVDDERCHVTCR